MKIPFDVYVITRERWEENGYLTIREHTLVEHPGFGNMFIEREIRFFYTKLPDFKLDENVDLSELPSDFDKFELGRTYTIRFKDNDRKYDLIMVNKYHLS